MRKPPRKKDEPVITKRLLARVLFSASIIVLGTLFVYAHELSDGSMSNRDQTMARFYAWTCLHRIADVTLGTCRHLPVSSS